MKLLIGLALFCALLASAAAADTAVAFFSLHIGAPSPPPPPAPVITFPAPSVAYIYPAAASSPLVNLTATVTTGTFAAGGGTFSSSDCAAQDILVSPNGNVQVAGPSNLTGSTSCTATAAYPGAISVSQTLTVTGTQQTIASVLPCPLPSQQTGPGCQYNFAAEATTQVLGAVPTPMTSGGISFADGSGTIVLGVGSQCSSFSISGGNLLITAPTAGEYDCTYVVTDSSAVSVSPVPIVAIATAAAGPLTIAVAPSTITLPCNAAPGTIAAFLSASGGNGAAITYSMSGSDASWAINGLNQVVVASGGIISGDCTSAPISYTMSAIQSGSTTSTASLAITASPPSSLTVANRLVVSGAAAQSQTNYPMQFGRPFVDGAIPHYPQVLINGSPAAYSQADVKNRYPDGSVEFAVISTIIPAVSASDCSISNTNPTEMPAYALWTAHNNLPVFNVPQNPTQDPLQNVLSSPNCHHIDGNGARTMISTENTTRASNVGGQAGFTEEPPYPAPSGTKGVMFSAMVCNGQSWCPHLSVGCDEESGCLWAPITPTASGDAVEAVTAVGGGTNTPTLIYFNGALQTPDPSLFPPPSTTPSEPYNTYGTLTWGADGDHVPAFETGVIISDQIFTTDTMSGATVAAVSAAINAFYATPGSASPIECSMTNVHCSVALSTTHRMVAGATKAFMLYNVSGKTTQDIGFDGNGATDVAAALTFCGSVANCRYQTIYDQTAEGVPGLTTITFQDTVTPDNTPQSLASMQALLPPGTTTLTLTPNTGSATSSPDAATMLAAGSYTLWTSGPVAQTIMLADDSATAAYDVGFGDGYKPFRPRYYATFWPALNKVFVRLVGENGNSTQQEDLKYKIAVADGYAANLSGTQATNSKFHWVNSRWTHTFWVGGAAPIQPVNIDEGLAYLDSTRFLPNLDATIVLPLRSTTAGYLSWQSAPHDIYDGYWDASGNTGWWNWLSAMGTAGNSYHIGPYPLSEMYWLHSADWRYRTVALNMVDLAASWPINIREGSTTRIFQRGDTPNSGTGLGRVISAAGRPLLNAYTGAPDNLTNVGAITAGPWTADDAHQPSVYFPAYVLTGDPWYLDMLYAWGGWTVFEDAGTTYYDCTTQTSNCSIFRGPSGAYGGMYGSKAPRAIAWTLRGRAETTFAAPDGVPEKNYFRYMTNDAIAKWEGGAGITGTAFDTATTKVWVKLTDFPYVWDSWGGPTPGLSGQYPPLGNMASGFCTPPTTLVTCGVPLTSQQNEYGLVPGANGTIDNGWMNFYLEYAIGRAVELGFPMSQIQAISDSYPIGVIASAHPAFLNSYGIGPEQQGGGFWASWSAYYAGGADPTYVANLDSGLAASLAPGAYITLAAPALATAVDDSVSGAVAAWAWYNTNVYSILSGNGSNASDPRWAIIPRTDSNVLPAQSTATPP